MIINQSGQTIWVECRVIDFMILKKLHQKAEEIQEDT